MYVYLYDYGYWVCMFTCKTAIGTFVYLYDYGYWVCMFTCMTAMGTFVAPICWVIPPASPSYKIKKKIKKVLLTIIYLYRDIYHGSILQGSWLKWVPSFSSLFNYNFCQAAYLYICSSQFVENLCFSCVNVAKYAHNRSAQTVNRSKIRLCKIPVHFYTIKYIHYRTHKHVYK